MAVDIPIEPLTPEAFSAFGQVVETGSNPIMINQGNCARHHDLAKIDIDVDGQAGISVVEGKPYTLPLGLNLMERHPLGSQCFMPMTDQPFLVVVASDEGGVPTAPKAFVTNGRQGVNYGRNVWHGVLTPLKNPALFSVIDRIGSGNNLQEHHLDKPLIVDF